MITDKVDDACYRATTAANNAREHAIAAARYENQALETAAAALRDERLAKYIKVTDFFDKAVEAWAAVGKVTAAAEAAAAAAKTTSEDARRIMNSEPPAGQNRRAAMDFAKDLFERATRAQDSAEEAVEEARSAQAAVDKSQRAEKQDHDSRKKESDHAARVVTGTQNVAASTTKTSAAALAAATSAEKVRSYACQAKAAATEGNIDSATSLATKADEAVAEVAKVEKDSALAKEQARKSLVELQLAR